MTVKNLIGEPMQLEMTEGISLNHLVVKAEIPESLLPQIAILNHGTLVKDWDYVITAGDQLAICVIPAGGGGGGKGGFLGAILMIAVIAASVYTMGAVGAAYGTMWGAAAGAAVSMVGMMVVNALIPPPSMNNGQNGISDGFTESQSYSLSGQSNQAKLYSSVPVVYGTYKVYPNIACTPRVKQVGKTSTISAAYDFGLGDVDLEDIRIGEQPPSSLGVNVRVMPNTNKPEFHYVSNLMAAEQFSFVLNANEVTVRTKSGAISATAILSFTRGLGFYNDRGGLDGTHVDINVMYRQVGTSAWTSVYAHQVEVADGVSAADQWSNPQPPKTWVGDEGSAISMTPGAGIWYGAGESGIIKTVSGDFVCDNGEFGADPAPGVYKACYLVNGLAAPSTYIGIRLSGATSKPNVINLNINFPSAGEYEIRMIRPGAASTDNRTSNELVLNLLQSNKVGEVVKLTSKHTMIEINAQASEKLTGVIQNLSAIAHKKIRYCDSNGWNGYGRTSNPAYIALDILTNEASPQQLKDGQIDFASFKRLADICDQDITRTINGTVSTFKRFQFNSVLDQQLTIQEAVNNVLSNGRAQLCIMPSGKFGVFIDSEKTTPKQLVTPANSWSFSGNRNFPEYPHALRVSFVEPNLQWARSEIMVYADGYSEGNATSFEELQLSGITNYGQAWCQGRYYMAQGRFRSETYQVNMDIENLVVQRGDLVAVQHDVPKMGGIACRVISNLAGVITLDQDFALTANAGYTVRLADGTIKTGDITASTVNTITLAVADPSIAQDDLMVIGERTKVTTNYLVMAIAPGDDLTATLTLTLYVPEVYTADTGAIPDWRPGFGTDPIAGSDLKVILPAVSQSINYVERNPFANVLITWRTDGNLGTLKWHEVYATYPDGTKVLLGTTDGTQFNWTVDLLGNKPLWNKDVKFDIVPINTLGNRGTAGSVTHNLLPDQIRPLVPEGYGVNIVNNVSVDIFWKQSRDPDIDHYEVRYSPDTIGAQWGQSQQLAKVDHTTTRTQAGARTGTYMLMAVDTSGNRSDILSLRTSVETLPKIDIVKVIDETATWPGHLVDMIKVGSAPQLTGNFGNVNGRGVYEYDEVFDAGTIDELRIQSLIKGFGFTADDYMASWIPLASATPLARATSGSYDAWLEVSTANFKDVMSSPRWVPLASVVPLTGTGSDWMPWRRVESADVTGRFFKFRIVCASYDKNVNVKLVSSKIEIDVLERTFAATDQVVTNAAGGFRVDFIPPFRDTPAIAVTIDGNIHALGYEVVSKSKSSAEVRLIDMTTGNPAVGKFDLLAIGWGKIRQQSL